MGLIKVTGLQNATGEVFPTIPAGLYPCRIVDVKQELTGPDSKAPGAPILKIKAKVKAGEEHENHTLFLNILLPTEEMDEDQKSMNVNKLKRLVSACGFKLDSDEFDTDDLQGSELSLKVGLKEINGKKSNPVDDYFPLA